VPGTKSISFTSDDIDRQRINWLQEEVEDCERKNRGTWGRGVEKRQACTFLRPHTLTKTHPYPYTGRGKICERKQDVE
jgi:hypothetical protein